MKRVHRVQVLLIALWLLPPGLRATEWTPQRLAAFTAETCRGWDEHRVLAEGYTGGEVKTSRIVVRGVDFGLSHRVVESDGSRLEIEVIENSARPRRFVSSFFNSQGKARLLISLGVGCSLQVARRINYDPAGIALNIDTLGEDFAPRGEPEWLNPPLQLDAVDDRSSNAPADSPSPLRVALVDSGVNYRLPEINRRLARDRDGALIGYDFWDLDPLPYDANTLREGFFVQRHGTRTASLLLREAPQVELVPYRYPRPEMTRMRDLVEHAARNGVLIIGVPLGGNRADDWTEFAEVAAEYPQILFVVSAGNNGRDIDQQPVYPASLALGNMLVVTSADDFVQPAERTNWGQVAVDYLIPAEGVPVLDYSGRTVEASGSSYAVPRLVALAARIRAAHPQWYAADLIAELERRYAASAARDWVSTGYIADPLAGAPIALMPLPPIEVEARGPDGRGLALDVLVLDPRWQRARVEQALREAYAILAQCGIVAGTVSLREFAGDDYLRDLSVGGAHTLLGAAQARHASIVFARDTRMQQQYTGEAFGRGNTSRRPWLADSVWLMLDVDDPGIALAHELYHVLANSGAHVEGRPNLMQPRTRPESVELTADQCQRALTVGAANGLLQ